jgi:1,4-dihydroxy-2-naphthoate octaprenyltransferase
VLLAGLGAFAVQTLNLSIVVVAALTAHALICTAMLVVHHYLDAPMDKIASPSKRTTVVALGVQSSRWYAASMAAVAAVIYGLLGALVQPAFFLGAGLTAIAVWVHVRISPTDMKSVTRNELRVIQLGIAGGLSTAVALAPPLWPMLPLAVVGYFAHLVIASPPAELARAWRKAPGD